MRKLTISCVFLFFLLACKDRRTGRNGEVSADNIFLNFKIWGEEDKEQVTCLFQFHYNGPEGTTLELEKPSTVKLDGEEITADSTPITGAYYEVQKPLDAFAGEHTITFIDLNNNQYKEQFSFTPFALRAELPEVVPRQDLQLAVEGLSPDSELQVIITDTAFATDDVLTTLPVENGRLVIPRQQLESVSSGPVIMQLINEKEHSVKAGTKAGGRIMISYSLSREFTLVD